MKINGVRPSVVNEDLDKSEKTVRFETNSLHEAIDAWVHIIVKGIPGFDYDNQYDVDIQFDPESLTLVKADQTPKPVTNLGTNNDNGTNNGNDDDLTYDRYHNGGGSGVENAANTNQQNPQTSDPALVSFYLALLLLSASFFVWKWKQNRRKAL